MDVETKILNTLVFGALSINELCDKLSDTYTEREVKETVLNLRERIIIEYGRDWKLYIREE